VGRKRSGRFDAIRHEWNEAPWFVLLILGVSAFVGQMIVFGLWDTITGWF